MTSVQSLLAMVCAASAALAAVSCTTPVPKQQRSGVRVIKADVRAFPPGSGADTAAAEIETTLADLYRRAFTPQPASPPPARTPPAPALPTAMFTAEAASAIAPHRDAFTPASEGALSYGDLSFSGVVSMGDGRPVEALVDVEFVGRRGRVRVVQTGKLLLYRMEPGWRVSGFDVTLRSERRVPPSPATRSGSRPSATAAWMPS